MPVVSSTVAVAVKFSIVPSFPSFPAGPCGPVAPVSPLGPCGPVAPVSPFSPLGPSGPVAPVSPVSPLGPLAPIAPAGPVAPLRPVKAKFNVSSVRVATTSGAPLVSSTVAVTFLILVEPPGSPDSLSSSQNGLTFIGSIP